jgi:hypothetical protein
MKSILKSNVEAVVAIILFPQIFVFLYFFFPTIRGADSLGMIKPLIILGLTISRLAGPILYALYWGITLLNRDKRRGVASFFICMVTGYLCVAAWNHYVWENFSYSWGLLPVFICSGGVGLYHFFKGKSYLELKSYLAPRKQELFLSPDA